jgi:glutathione peroxidase
MKRYLMALAALTFTFGCSTPSGESQTNAVASVAPNEKLPIESEEPKLDLSNMKSLHDFNTQTLTGENFDFASLKGKRVLIVNTASECGYTPQYEQLQELYETYGGEDFTVVGFPSNDFGGQEPGSNEEIKAFCQKNFGVTFPMMAKTPVKGNDQHAIYSWLCNKDQNGVDNASVAWNFNKFLIDEKGHWVAYYPSNVGPLNERITNFAQGK